jgi:hypothetical protein
MPPFPHFHVRNVAFSVAALERYSFPIYVCVPDRSEKRMAGRQSRSDFDATAHTECMHATLSRFLSS